MIRRQKLIVKESVYDPTSIHIPRGSDKRIPGGIQGVCALCDETKQLRLSHIVPRWMYKWAKAECTIVGTYRTLGIRTAEKDSRKHYLLCDPCEQHLGKAENYLSILQDENRGMERMAVGLQFLPNQMILGLDFDLILRFLAGIAFKASLVDSPPYHAVKFSQAYAADCKRSLLGQPTVQTFTFYAMRFLSEVAEGVDPRAMIYVQRAYIPRMGEALVILAAGWEWNLIRYKNQVSDWPHVIQGLPINKNLPALVPWGEITEHRFVNPQLYERP